MPTMPTMLLMFLCGCGVISELHAQEPESAGAADDQRQRAERAIELLVEAEALLEGLPPDLLDEVERRVAAAAEPAASEPQARTRDGQTPTRQTPTRQTDEPSATEPVVGESDDRSPMPSATSTAAEPVDSATAAEIASVESEPPRRETGDVTGRRVRARCDVLAPLDSDGDGWISGADRWWRYLFLWNDEDRNDVVGESEIVQPFEVGVRRIASRLDRYEGTKELVGDVFLDGERVVLTLPERRRRPAGRLTLVLDADRLARRDGPVLELDGKTSTGYLVVTPGLVLRDQDQEQTFGCP